MRWLAFTAVLLVAVTSAPSAFAQSRPAAGSGGGGASTTSTASGGAGGDTAARPSSGRTASLAQQAIARAQAAYVARDYPAALEAYRQAAAAGEAERAEATLGMGAVFNAQNNVDEALSAFRDAARYALARNDHLNRLRALQAVANRLEASGRWDDANRAWDEFIAVAEAHPDLGSAANGRARQHAIRSRNELNQQYAQVRQRIEERQRQNAQGPRQQGN